MNNSDVFRSWTTDVIRVFVVLVSLLWFSALVLRAGTHYVSLQGTNDIANGYITWSGAATQIQWAVSVATNGETVLVSNGTYNLTNQVNIFSNITVRSFTEQGHGSNDTIVNGNNYEGKLVTNRCFYMTNGVLDGFTISNGYDAGTAAFSGGGGVWVSGGYVYNCFIYRNCSSNTATQSGGGGIYLSTMGTATNCTIVSNIVVYVTGNSSGGGGAYVQNGGRLVASRISGNTANQLAYGVQINGGIVSNCTVDNNNGIGIYTSGTLANSIVSNNTGQGVHSIGGSAITKDSTIVGNSDSGVGMEYSGLVSNCQVIANRGGGIYIDNRNSAGYTIANCTIARNASVQIGGIYVGFAVDTSIHPILVKNCLICCNTNAASGAGVILAGGSDTGKSPGGLINCTIVSNQSKATGGGIYASSTTNNIENCIIYSNTTTTAGDDYDEVYNVKADNTNNYWYTCVRPMPGAANTTLAPNQGNITNNPMFIDFAAGNYRLSANSPCINRGTNESWMMNSYDLDGRTRIRYGTVDMGAYELIRSGTTYCFH